MSAVHDVGSAHADLEPRRADIAPRRAAAEHRQRPLASGVGHAALDVGTVPVHDRTPPPLPDGLVLGDPSDPLEVEADSVADRLHGATTPTSRPMAPARTAAATSAYDALRGPGRALDDHIRSRFQRSLDHDFGDVRVYTSPQASRAAHDLDARAFAVGSRIGFADGQFSTTSGEGRRLLAHELTHVVQQRNARTPQLLRRKPWGKPPKGKRVPASQMFLWRSAEAYAILQYTARNSGHVLITNEMLATGVRPNATGADKAVVDAIFSEFHHGHENKRRTVEPAGDVTERAESEPFSTLQAAVDTAKALQQPDIIDVTTSEVYDVTTVGERDTKVSKINNRYLRLLNTITTRTWSSGTRLQPFTPLTTSLGKLGNVSFAATDFAKWPGVIQYEVIKPDDKKTKKKKKKPAVKKKSPAKSAKPHPAKKAPAKPAKAQPAKKAPTASPPGGNVGFGIGIMSSGGGKGNAVLGVSINSSGTSFGTVSAGVVYNSSGDAVGAVSVGAGANTSGISAASATAGASSGTSGISVATAGAGTSKNSTATSVATAGTGSNEDVSAVAIAEVGAGDVKDAGDTQATPKPPGGSGTGTGSGAESAGTTMTREGTQGGGTQGEAADGGATQGGAATTDATAGGGRSGGLQVPGMTDARVTQAVTDAARIDAELRKLSDAQRNLLAAIIQRSDAGEHPVGSTSSVAAFAAATSGLSAADLAFLETQQWVPGDVSADVPRQQIEDRLKNRDKPQGTSPRPAEGRALDHAEKSAEKAIAPKPPVKKPSKKSPNTETHDALYRRLLDRAQKTDWSAVPTPGMVSWPNDNYGPVSGAVYVNEVIDGARVTFTGDIAGIRSKTPTGDVLEVTTASAILVSPDGNTVDGTFLVGHKLTFSTR